MSSRIEEIVKSLIDQLTWDDFETDWHGTAIELCGDLARALLEEARRLTFPWLKPGLVRLDDLEALFADQEANGKQG